MKKLIIIAIIIKEISHQEETKKYMWCVHLISCVFIIFKYLSLM